MAFCFGWGLKRLKGPKWGLFLKGFNKEAPWGLKAPWGLALAAMCIFIRPSAVEAVLHKTVDTV